MLKEPVFRAADALQNVQPRLPGIAANFFSLAAVPDRPTNDPG